MPKPQCCISFRVKTLQEGQGGGIRVDRRPKRSITYGEVFGGSGGCQIGPPEASDSGFDRKIMQHWGKHKPLNEGHASPASAAECSGGNIFEDEFFFADKPAGYSTHAASDIANSISLSDAVSVFEKNKAKRSGNLNTRRESKFYVAEGLVEYLERVLEQPLFVCHRLDKETTGALVFARNKKAAAQLAALFAARKVRKSYLFVTDRTVQADTFSVSSWIEKRGGDFVSLPSADVNATTHFEKVKSEGRFSLWQAHPETGRPHQIRLHAAESGIPILGDLAHGGSPFPALLLHSHELRFKNVEREIVHRCEPPLFFEQLPLLQDSVLVQWLAAFDRRQRWLKCRIEGHRENKRRPSPILSCRATDAWRAIHSEGGPLRIDKLGPSYSLQWFAESLPEGEDQRRLTQLLTLQNISDWTLHLRQDRGRNPNSEQLIKSGSDLTNRWTIVENGLSYEIRADSGLSSGLFLDQRANRYWVRRHAGGRSVLNLFCYTGAFSVCAAAGNAKKVVSVDISRNFLAWAKRNFELNQIELNSDEAKKTDQLRPSTPEMPRANHPYEFRHMDTRDYLKYAQKKGLSFDLIICDPPSFGRSERGVFRLEQDLPALIKEMAACLNANGEILLCCNYEGWSEFDFLDTVQRATAAAPGNLSLEFPPPPDWDFELPRQSRQMKCVILRDEGS